MTARVLVSTRGMDRADWLSARRAGLGGSDIAALTRGQLWAVYADKLGLADPTPETEAMRRGNGLEAWLRGEVARRHPTWRITQRHAILQHPTEDWALANIDGLIRTPEGEGVLEIKTSRQSWPDGVPEAYQVQVQHYLAVTGAPWAVVAVLFGNFDTAEYTVAADPALQAALLDLGRAFWARVQRQDPPPLDGSEAARAWLLARYTPATRPAPVVLDPALVPVAARYVAVSQELKALQAERDALGVQLRAAIGDAPAVVTPTHRLTWVRSTATHVDLDGLRRDHGDVVAQYTTERPRDGGLRLSALKGE